jgi:hypothetical protein
MKTLQLFILILVGISVYGQEFPSPHNYSSTIDNDSIYMTWQAPEGKTLSHYNIYFYGYTPDNPLKIGTTTNTAFTWALPDFKYTMHFLVSAEYENPYGNSDTIHDIWTAPILLEIPTAISFDNGIYQYSFTSNIIYGTDFWTLTDNTSYSGTHSAQFISTTENAKSQLKSAPFEGANLIVKFMCKIPANGSNSDTLRLKKAVNSGQPNYFETLTNINDWQQIQYEFDAADVNSHLLFEATCGMGNGVFIDDVTIESIVSIPNQKDEVAKINIAPHPVTETSILTLPKTDEEAIVKIYSTTGQIMFVKTIKNSLRISNSNFPAGMYLYEVTFKNGEKLHGRIVIQK